MSPAFRIMKHKAKRASFGFTLIELLAVVAIFAVIASMVVLTIGQDPHRLMEDSAKRFVAQLELVSEEAAMRGIEFGLLVDEDENNYRFLIYAEDRWKPSPIPEYARPTVLPESLNLSIQLTDDEAVNFLEGGNILFDENFDYQDEERLLPQIAILSSGEFTPFVFTLENSDASERVRINVDIQGKHELERENDYS